MLNAPMIGRCSRQNQTTPLSQRDPKAQSSKPQNWIMVGGHPPAAADHEKIPSTGVELSETIASGKPNPATAFRENLFGPALCRKNMFEPRSLSSRGLRSSAPTEVAVQPTNRSAFTTAGE